MSAQLDTLTASVNSLIAACESAVTLLGTLKADLDAAGSDTTALAALGTFVDAETAKLQSAISTNTPV